MPITFASGLTAAAKDSKHRRTPSELPLRGGSLLCACGNLHQPCDCLLLLYATPCKSQASGKKFIFTSKYILPDITKTALPKQSRRKSSSGLRLPASTSHLERCSCLAGRGPNSSPLAGQPPEMRSRAPQFSRENGNKKAVLPKQNCQVCNAG